MLDTPYRNASAPVGRRMSTGWICDVSVVALIAWLAACAIALVGAATREPGARIDCDATGCWVQARKAPPVWLPREGRYVLAPMSRDMSVRAADGPYFVRVEGTMTLDIDAGTKTSASALASDLGGALTQGAPLERTYADESRFSLFVALFCAGLALTGVWLLRHRDFEFDLDPFGDHVSVRLRRGLVPWRGVRERCSSVTTVVAEAVRPDYAFSRYRVLLRMRDGTEVAAIPLTLPRRSAQALATRVAEALASRS
jgi:hypothetical protein